MQLKQHLLTYTHPALVWNKWENLPKTCKGTAFALNLFFCLQLTWT